MFEYKNYGKRLLHNTLICISEYLKPMSYLEIGVREGDSLKAVLFGHSLIGEIYLCDSWGPQYGGTGRGNHKHIEEFLKRMKYDGIVKFLDGDSKYMIPTLYKLFDLILVDGDHSMAGAKIDLINCWKLLKDDGYLVFDDIAHKSHLYLHACVMDFVMKHNAKIFYKNLDDNGVIVLRKGD